MGFPGGPDAARMTAMARPVLIPSWEDPEESMATTLNILAWGNFIRVAQVAGSPGFTKSQTLLLNCHCTDFLTGEGSLHRFILVYIKVTGV